MSVCIWIHYREYIYFKFFILHSLIITAAWLAQLGERRSAEWEVVSSNPSWNNKVRVLK